MYSSQKGRNISSILGKKSGLTWKCLLVTGRKSPAIVYLTWLSHEIEIGNCWCGRKDRAWLWDDPLIVLNYPPLLGFNFGLYSLPRYLCMLMGKPLANISEVSGILWQIVPWCLRVLVTLWLIYTRVSEVLATLWEICTRVTERVGNPQWVLASGVNTVAHICQRVANAFWSYIQGY
jgi:hypothetical protein